MLTLFERDICSVSGRLVLLAPTDAELAPAFLQTAADSGRHRDLLHGAQRLRGASYLKDGAIHASQLTADGRLETPEDARAWHLLMLDNWKRVSACVWYLEHEMPASLKQLKVRNCPLTADTHWRGRFELAVHSELGRARRDGLRYVEIGGWAVEETSRRRSEGLVLALAAYSLGRLFGGALGLTTATVRHHSSAILRRLGGSCLEANGSPLPPYYDPRYNCQMELLRFDSRQPSFAYAGAIDLLKEQIVRSLVVRPEPETVHATEPEAAYESCLALPIPALAL